MDFFVWVLVVSRFSRCPLGAYPNTVSRKCVYCPSGYTGVTALQLSGYLTGSQANGADSTDPCKECVGGDTAGMVGMLLCSQCVAGTKATAGQAGCDVCPSGTYSRWYVDE